MEKFIRTATSFGANFELPATSHLYFRANLRQDEETYIQILTSSGVFELFGPVSQEYSWLIMAVVTTKMDGENVLDRIVP